MGVQRLRERNLVRLISRHSLVTDSRGVFSTPAETSPIPDRIFGGNYASSFEQNLAE
jgi:hypothetical protein